MAGDKIDKEKKLDLLRNSDACHLVRDFVAHFANPLRLQILCELSQHHSTVNELVVATGARQPAVSQQLNLLRLSGIVARTRDGNKNVYRIADPLADDMMEFLFHVADRLTERQNNPEGKLGAC